MILKTYTKKDIPIIETMIAKISRGALQIFQGALKNNQLRNCYLDLRTGKRGVCSIVENDEYISTQLSFVDDVDEKVLQELTEIVQELIDTRGKKDLYLNMCAKNQVLIDHFTSQDFSLDNLGKEYRYQRKNWPAQLQTPVSKDLKVVDYDQRDVDFYIDLLDAAFKPLDLAYGEEPGAFRRNRQRIIQWLSQKGETGDFLAIWAGFKLVGLLIVKRDIIDYFAIDPAFQRQGYGKELLKASLQKMFLEKGYSQVYLYCLEKNVSGQNFYEKQGFELTGHYFETTYRPEGRE